LYEFFGNLKSLPRVVKVVDVVKFVIAAKSFYQIVSYRSSSTGQLNRMNHHGRRDETDGPVGVYNYFTTFRGIG